MKLIEMIRKIFHCLFCWNPKGRQQEVKTPPIIDGKANVGGHAKGMSSTKKTELEHSSTTEADTTQQQPKITTQTVNGNNPEYPKRSKVIKTYTVQTVPFLTLELDLDYNAIYTVKYSISDSVNAKFPIICAPKKGCEIKLPVIGRSGKRGFCEQKLCDEIKNLKLQGFYDGLSLFVLNNDHPYEPDLAYVDARRGIFIDIEVDEPYSGWERLPIHYKSKNGTIDDRRNNYFTERGWTVIRFSEKQVYKHPRSCLKRVYQLLYEIDVTITMPKCLATEADISPDDIWTKEQAERMEKNKEREKMLDIDKFIQPVEAPHTTIEDYPHGQEIEKKFISSRKQWKVSGQIQSKFIVNPPQLPKVSISNPDEQRRREAEQYEHPQQISTQTKPQTTPSSRGYA